MSHTHFFGALSSLLLLILAATSEVNTFDYYHQNSCNVENSIFKNYTLTSYVYNCVVNENSIKDFGCKDDVEKACADISPGDYYKRLTFVKDENDTFIDGDNYVTCKNNYCNDCIRMNSKRLKKHFKLSLRLGIRNIVIAEMVKLLFLFKLIAVQFFMEVVSILYDWISVQF